MQIHHFLSMMNKFVQSSINSIALTIVILILIRRLSTTSTYHSTSDFEIECF